MPKSDLDLLGPSYKWALFLFDKSSSSDAALAVTNFKNNYYINFCNTLLTLS
jgi:hypothetical protein